MSQPTTGWYTKLIERDSEKFFAIYDADRDHLEIATLSFSNGDDAAIARKLAAAPLLYEALRFFVEIEQWDSTDRNLRKATCTYCGMLNKEPDHRCALVQARAALRAVEGEEPLK